MVSLLPSPFCSLSFPLHLMPSFALLFPAQFIALCFLLLELVSVQPLPSPSEVLLFRIPFCWSKNMFM